MQVERGSRLGPYEIVSRLGAGGMGEVWQARDTRLDRGVAIKILPASLAESAQFQVRFEREAKTISQLNHPHICTLHDVGHSDGTHYLVMELLEGETLADRIAKGPLPLEDVFRFGREIAEALDRAHRQGVVHRDLKPANVMITRSGVKLLDFGLAKAGASATSISATSHLTASDRHEDATQQKPLTQEGTILGTLQYMAPEQVAGEEADHRSDIFALGVVIYEMATGQRAFHGKTRTSLFAAIVGGEPRPLRELQPLTPPALEHVIQKCLEKDPEHRWQSAHDIAEELRWISGAGSQAGVAAPIILRRKTRERLAWSLHLLTAIAAIAATWWFMESRKITPPPTTSSIELPPGTRSAINSGHAISPDGATLVAVLDDQRGLRALWIRPIGVNAFRMLEGTAGASVPFWSADSKQIGFFAGGKMLSVDAAGGPPQAIVDAPAPRGASWAPDGTIVFSGRPTGPLMKVSANGGTPVPATTLAAGERTHRWPWFLPDGKHFLYVAITEAGAGGIYRGSLDDVVARKFVVSSRSSIAATADALIYGRGTSAVAQKFNSRTGEVSGSPVPILDGVATTERLSMNLAVSRNGTLVGQRGAGFVASRLIWIDRNGSNPRAITGPGLFFTPRISHDGRRVAVDRSNPADGQGDLWIHDLSRNVQARLTYQPENESGPNWSNDDRRIYYHYGSPGASAIQRVATGGTGAVETLVTSLEEKRLTDVSRDERFALFDVVAGGNLSDIWVLSLADGKATPWLATPFNELGGELSPDGNWIVYQSDESGQNEIYIRQFPHSERKWPVTNGGGMMATWRGDGRQIFYLSPDGKLMAVDVKPGEDLQAGAPVPLFEARLRMHAVRQYDVTPDGSRFLLNQLDEGPSEPLTLMTNWTSRLNR